jgi:hypothetical protein
MTPRRHLLPALALALQAALLPCLSAVESAITVPPGVRVSAIGLYPDYWPYGYLDHRFLVENSSARRLVVTLRLPESHYGGGLQDLSRSLVLDPGATARVSLPQPPVDLRGNDSLLVIVQGGERKAATLRSFPDLQNRWSIPDGIFGLLISRSLSAETISASFEKASALETSLTSRTSSHYSPHSSGSDTKRYTRPEIDVEAWSPDWRAYTPFAGVVLAGRDWARVPADVSDALLAYVRAGGILLLAGPPESAAPFPVPPASGSPTNGWQRTPHGLGSVVHLDQPDPAKWPTSTVVYLQAAFKASSEPWKIKPDFDEAHRACPVVAGIRVPARAFFLTLLAFALLAGPGVLLYTRRRNNRLLRFILIPALSLVTTAGIVAFAFFQDGWTPSVRIESITWLDTATQRAATVGSVGVYAPFTPAEGLLFGTETEVSPLGDQGYSYQLPRCAIDWTRTQNFDSGWIRPRVPSYFHLRRSEKRLERLVVTRGADGALDVVNALGGDVRSLTLQEPGGRFLRAGAIRAGGRAALEVVPKIETKPGPPAAYQLETSLSRKGDNWGLDGLWFNPSNAPAVPEPGRFVALLESCPFLENPLPGDVRVQARAVVVGTFTAEPAPGAAAQGVRP